MAAERWCEPYLMQTMFRDEYDGSFAMQTAERAA
jgi:hypothetical protein